MPAGTSQIPLHPSLCFPPTTLTTFLARSRALVDDPISQNLSALSNPSALPFQETPNRGTPSTSRLPARTCAAWVRHNLLPAWAERERVLSYCENLAAATSSPLGMEAGAKGRIGSDVAEMGLIVDERLQEQQEPDERLDPYSARRETVESDSEILGRNVRAQREVEGIVRRRTLEVLRDRCERLEGLEGWDYLVEELERREKQRRKGLQDARKSVGG